MNQEDLKVESPAPSPVGEIQLDEITKTRGSTPMAAWFLGPKAEHSQVWQDFFTYIFDDYVHWRRNYFPNDPIVISRQRQREHEGWIDQLNTSLDEVLNQLKAHFPFYSPRYLAHMLSEQTLPSVLGYFAGMLYNPNNVTEEAAPVTVQLELEVGKMVAEMLGYNPRNSWAHITSGGTIANLEALWVARAAQFVPFTIREICQARKWPFEVKTANREPARLIDIPDAHLIALPPNESIYMPGKFALYLANELGVSTERIDSILNEGFASSSFNVNKLGYAQVQARLTMKPTVYVSAAAHYSIKKACDVLGYGEDAVHLIPVTSKFRIDIDALQSAIVGRNKDSYLAAVIGIVGTTEEGAVDPIHELHFLRKSLATNNNESFWLHADAAWGGYVASLFRGHNLTERKKDTWQSVTNDYIDAIDARDRFEIEFTGPPHSNKRSYRNSKHFVAEWSDQNVYAAYLAMKNCDSITIDPHKMGYVPYPAGVVAFRNRLVTDIVTQKANYISEAHTPSNKIDDPPEVTAVGPYILEGSKPGAAAASCWLAHKMIPLEVTGHGKIARTTVLNAARLQRYLAFHRRLYFRFEEELGVAGDIDETRPFTFVPLFEPDTNIVCFVARPMMIQGGKLTEVDCSLTQINSMNRSLYRSLGKPPNEFRGSGPYGHPYFVSRTFLEKEQYSARSIRNPLTRIGVPLRDYEQQGLFVLRSTVMNPYYWPANNQDETGPNMDYLLDFVRHLHFRARQTKVGTRT